jgi:hypothetical protein
MLVKNSLLIASSVLIIIGCSGGDSIVKSNSNNFTTATVQINNTTSLKVFQLYFKDEYSNDWGYDMISSDNFIKANSRVDFTTSLCDKTIDVKATGLLGSPIWMIPDVYVECGKTGVVTLTVN